MNLATIIGNRATYYRQKVLFDLLAQNKDINLSIILTGSLLTEPFKDVLYELETDYNVFLIPLTNYDKTFESMAKSSVKIQNKCIDILKNNNIELSLALADRWEQLPFAIASAYLDVKLAHIQGGEISGNIDDKVRNAISALSDIHFPTHKYAADKLRSFGYSKVFNFGCPSIDIIKESSITRTKADDYFIVMFHPHTNEINSLAEQTNCLVDSVKKYIDLTGYKCYWFLGNDDPGANEITLPLDNSNVKFVTNLTGSNYLKLLANSKFIIGNSSSGIREASYLGVPSINLGDRQNNRVKANNVITIKQFDSAIICKYMENIKEVKPSKLFGNGESSKSIMNYLMGVI